MSMNDTTTNANSEAPSINLEDVKRAMEQIRTADPIGPDIRLEVNAAGREWLRQQCERQLEATFGDKLLGVPVVYKPELDRHPGPYWRWNRGPDVHPFRFYSEPIINNPGMVRITS